MLSVTDAACVATAAEVYYYLNKGGCVCDPHWTTELYRRPQQTHENLVTDLRISKPNDYKIC